MTTLISPRTKRGGPRPGSGRKPGELTQRFREYFARDLDGLMAALRDLALGHYREDDRGRVYAVAPDRQALCYVLDRLLGKVATEGAGDRDREPADLAAVLAALRDGGTPPPSSPPPPPPSEPNTP
jgi:hypothetical protein